MLGRKRSTRARRRKRVGGEYTQPTRASRLEVLERRWLLAIDLSTVAFFPATGIAYPTVRVYHPAGVSQPDGTIGPTGYTPPQISQAYGFNQIQFNGITGTGAGQTIAIVDAYDTPTIQHDLQQFDLAFGLPDPPSFIRVAEDGTTNYPSVDPAGPGGNNWEVETALDVEWAHALAPQANIVLVEATTNYSDLWTAVNFARNYPGVSVVSMSFTSSEAVRQDSLFTTPAGHIPITFVASTGDNGVPGGYPALSPNVLAVGGTTLTLNGSNNITSETGWSGSGGGISTVAPQPAYQSGIVTQSQVLRTIPDVSFDANPSTGASIYDSYNNGTSTPWTKIGGTSFSAPSWAALIAVADQGRTLAGLSTLDGRSGTLPAIYSLPSSDFRDITSGNNGDPAGAGYDLVTGRGSPVANLIANGLVTASTISGTVFSDSNSNGVLDANETGLAGWTVYDDLNNNGVLDPPAVSTTSANISSPLAIPDGPTGSLTSTLTVSALQGSIMDINVNLTINHPRDSNLTVTLISPAGTSISLIRNNGSTGANFTNTTLDDQAGTAISAGTAPFTGSFKPIAVLSTLNGQNPNGTWSLVVADTVAGNTGTLVGWSLQILTPTEPSVRTGGDGVYDFLNASAGTHHIRELVPPGFTQNGPSGGVYNVTVASGVNAAGQDFAAQGSSVSGELYFDSNANTVLDPGEVGVQYFVFDDLNNNGTYDSTSQWSDASSDVPKSILDQTTILSGDTVTGLSGAITDINVSLSINHTRDSNLAVTLISPAGTYVPLINHNGGNGANFTNTTLDDQASLSITTGTAPFSNSYRPASVLSALNGQNPNGVWKLMVVDSVTGNTGTLNSWSLNITTNAAEPIVLSNTDGTYQVANLNAGTHHILIPSLGSGSEIMAEPTEYNVAVTSQAATVGKNFGFLSSVIPSTGGPYVINEGSSLTLNGSASGGVAPYTFAWDINGDGDYSDTTDPDATLTWSQLNALGITNGPSTYNMRLLVQDSNDGFAVSVPVTLTVLNVPPTSNAGGPYTINEGSPLTLSGSGTDPVDTNLTYSWDVNGDGVFGDAVGANPTLTWSQLVALGINNGPSTYHVTLQTSDGDGGMTASTPVTLTVLNVPPTSNAGGPYTINEGSPLTLSGSGTDPVDVNLSYSWDVNGDGVFGDAVGANPTLTWSQLVALGINNGPSTYNVTLQTSDGDGGVTASTPVTLTVLNVPPTSNAGGPYTINEGSPLTLSGSGTDPVDTNLNYSWDVNGDGVFGDAVGANPTLTWSQLVALGINNGPSTYNVTLQTSDGNGGVTVSAPVILTVLNVLPTSNAGGPYTINEGSPLTLSGSGTDPVDTNLSYSWDVNGDGVFGDAVGAHPTLTWNQLVALGINNGPSTYNVTLQTSDADGGVAVSAPAVLTINNVPPVVGISGATSTLRGVTQSYTLTATDPSPADQAASMTFTINWGDGSPVQVVTGTSGTKVTHGFNTTGSLTASITATDQDGGTSAAVTLGVHVDSIQLLPDAQNRALTDLVWGGTTGNDLVSFQQISATTIRVTEQLLNGTTTNNVQDYTGITGRVIAYGNPGNDQLDARGLQTTQATLDGGAGNNTIYGGSAGDTLIGGSNGGEGTQGSNVIVAGNGNNTIYGNAATGAEGSTGGNNLIIGGSGNDTIYGSYGNVVKSNGQPSLNSIGGENLIVGGGGADTIYASQAADGAEGGHGSILVAGTTTLNQAALQSILNEWTSARIYSQRIANIEGIGTGPSNNGSNYLQPGVTVSGDGAIDQLFSDTNGSPNWFLLTLGTDSVNRMKSNETETDTG